MIFSQDENLPIIEDVSNVVGETLDFSQPSSSLEPWQAGKVLFGDYIVIKLIGKGGSGHVHLVRRLFDTKEFAVKTVHALLHKESNKNHEFLRELYTWKSLPPHPNITACHFFKTVDDRFAIFAEHVSGGSLRDWILNRKLNSVELILDTAIQIAWSIGLANDCGVIHQDIKPSNILMTPDGIPKLTDFGLARIQLTRNIESLDIVTGDAIVSSQGLTPAYCSPEQAMSKPLTIGSDIWSFGLTLFEMLTGRILVKLGFLAQDAMNEFPSKSFPDDHHPIPKRMIPLFDRCFMPNPVDRWSNFEAIADELINVYHEFTGIKYPRKKPSVSAAASSKSSGRQFFYAVGAGWDAPELWVAKAQKLAEKLDVPFRLDVDSKAPSDSLWMLKDLAQFKEISSIYMKAYSQEDESKAIEYCQIIHNIASIQMEISDHEGAIISLREIQRVLGPSIPKTLDVNIISLFCRSLIQQGIVLLKLEDTDTALATFQEAGKTISSFNGENRESLIFELSKAYINTATALSESRKYNESANMLKQAIQVFEQSSSMHQEGKKRYKAICLINLAGNYLQSGKFKEASDVYDKAEGIFRHWDKQQDFPIRQFLAEIFIGRGIARGRLGDLKYADSQIDTGLKISQELAEEQDSPEIINELSTSYSQKAIHLMNTNRLQQSLSNIEESIKIRKALVFYKGHYEWVGRLAMLFLIKAQILSALMMHQEALDSSESAISILDRIAGRNPQASSIERLIIALSTQIAILRNTSHNHEMVHAAEKLIPLYDLMINDFKRTDMRTDLGKLMARTAEAHLKLGNNIDAEKKVIDATTILDEAYKETRRSDILFFKKWMKINLFGIL